MNANCTTSVLTTLRSPPVVEYSATKPSIAKMLMRLFVVATSGGRAVVPDERSSPIADVRLAIPS